MRCARRSWRAITVIGSVGMTAALALTACTSSPSSARYWSADQFSAMMATAAKSGPLTASAVQKTVNGGFVYHGPQGYITSQSWPSSETEATASCAGVLRVDTPASAYKLAVPFTCSPVMKLATIPGLIP